MRAPKLLLSFLLIGAPLAAQVEQEVGCIVCHGAEGKQFASSVHVSAGISCVDCHTGNAVSMEKATAHGESLMSGADASGGVELCASCHANADSMRGTGLRTDQLSLYQSSRHGIALGEGAGKSVATCVSCHSSHAIFRTTDPRSPAHKFNQPETCGSCHSDSAAMESVGLLTGITEDYSKSVHGKALLESNHLSSPSCSDCHGSHGATPPGYESVGRICGDCHSVVLNYFEQSPHLPAARSGELEECTSCHGFHDLKKPSTSMLVEAGVGHCAQCHTDPAEPARGVAQGMYAALEDFDSKIRDAEENVRDAGLRGFFMDREHGYLDEARSLRARARSLTHTLSEQQLRELLSRGDGMIGQTHDSLGVKARTFRDRKIFTSIFLAVTLLLAGVLQTYRREIFGTRRHANLGPRGKRGSGS